MNDEDKTNNNLPNSQIINQLPISNSSDPNLTAPPTIQSSSKQNFTNKKPRRIIFILIIIILIIFVIMGVFAYERSNKSKKSSVTTTNLSDSINSTPTINYVTIPIGNYSSKNSSNCTITYDNCPIPSQNFAVAQGHYVYIDFNDNSSDPTLGAAAIYDGKTVYKNSNIISGNVIISQNGLHYAFATDDGKNYTIYIDGKPTKYVLNSENQSTGQFLLYDVSNNGQSIAYDYQNTQGDDVLYINGKSLGDLSQIIGVNFSSNLNKYLALTDSTTENKVILNGTTVLKAPGTSINYYSSSSVISENGQHYAYEYYLDNPDKYTLIIDGKNVGQITDPNFLGINDNGSYYYIDASSALLYINGRVVNLNPKYISLNILQNSDDNIQLAVSSNEIHYLLMNSTTHYFVLDGKVISLTGDIIGSDFSNNTLNVYRFSK